MHRRNGPGLGVGQPGRPERLPNGEGAQDPAVEVHGVRRRNAEAEDSDDHHGPWPEQRSQAPDYFDVAGIADQRHGERSHQGTQDHREECSQDAARVGCPERRGRAGALRHVAGVVRDVGSVGELPQGGDGDGGHEANPVEVSLVQEAGRQSVDGQDPDEGQHQRQTGHDAQDACIGVNEPVAENGGNDADDANDNDACINTDARADCGHCLAAKDEVRRKKPDVHDHHDDNDQQRPV